MLVIPAIDLKDGKCVRLRQGRMDDDTVYSDDPVAMACHWLDNGARRLHLVDLNGAFAGEPVNHAIINAIASECRRRDVPVQIGGGIRTVDTARAYLQAGVSFVIIGSKAVSDPDFVSELCREIPGHVIVGIDARDGKVAVEGWAEVSEVGAVDLARRFESDGVSAIVYTDISRDGMLSGVNVDATVELARSVDIPVIASGGLHNEQDIRALCQRGGILGAITGKAIYEGTLDLASAQRLADELSV